MITLKNKVEPKADKDYVDFEITKQNALINNTFVKKTGDQMNGDLILPHYNYPVEGNTNHFSWDVIPRFGNPRTNEFLRWLLLPTSCGEFVNSIGHPLHPFLSDSVFKRFV